MKRMSVRALGLALCILLQAAPAYARQEASVVFDGTLEQLQVQNGNLFFGDERRLLPGDTASSNILLVNRADYSLDFYMSASATGADYYVGEEAYAGALELLELLEIQVALRKVDSQGNIGAVTRVVYEGPATGSGTGGNSLAGFMPLGSWAPGGWAVLQVTLRLPVSLGNAHRNALAALDWSFYCTGNPGNSGTGTSPDRSGSGPGGGSGGGSDTGSGVTIINDNPTPAGTIEIVDSAVPLGNLPRTGGGLAPRQQGPIWLLLIVAAAVFALWRHRKQTAKHRIESR